MAKTFRKPAPPLNSPEVAKPISERDFFDLTDEPIAQPTGKQRDNNTDNTSNTGNKKAVSTTSNSSTNAVSSVEPSAGVLTAQRAVIEGEAKDMRQTFVVSSIQLEQLRDYVHSRRVQGNYEYSQKQALQEALDLLFASVPPAPPRPEQTRQLEQQRRERIQRGRTR
jgi:hypothetical protein